MFDQYLTRQQKAERLLDGGFVHQDGEHPELFGVDSESDPDLTYQVNVKDQTCGCPDFARGHRCKHLIAASKAATLLARPQPVIGPAKRTEFLEEIDLPW